MEVRGESMRRLLCLMLISMLCAPAAQAGVVIWLADELPEERVLRRSDVRTGGTGHLAANYLAYPPSPLSDSDRDSYELLRVAMDEANRRWEEYEIEYAVAKGLEQVIDSVQVIRDERDRDAMIAALLFQGAAAHVAFDEESFRADERAEPFRFSSAGKVLNRPWMEALALNSERAIRRSDLADGASFPAIKGAQEAIDSLASGRIRLPKLADDEKVVWNGVVQDDSVTELTVKPGRHWLHLLRGEEVHGRAVVSVAPGDEVAFPMVVSDEEMAEARAQVLRGTTIGFPDSLKSVLSNIAQIREEAVYIAALEGNHLEVLPYTRGATLVEQQLVTVVSAGEVGASLVTSDFFDQANGQTVSVPAAHGGLGVELGISYASLLAGVDLAITPNYTVTHADRDNLENVTVSTLPSPYGGLGVYALRPTGATPSLLFAGTVSFDYPAFIAFGGRLSVGLPIDKRGNWFRLTVGAKSAPRTLWEESAITGSMNTYFFRTGFGALL